MDVDFTGGSSSDISRFDILWMRRTDNGYEYLNDDSAYTINNVNTGIYNYTKTSMLKVPYQLSSEDSPYYVCFIRDKETGFSIKSEFDCRTEIRNAYYFESEE